MSFGRPVLEVFLMSPIYLSGCVSIPEGISILFPRCARMPALGHTTEEATERGVGCHGIAWRAPTLPLPSAP